MARKDVTAVSRDTILDLARELGLALVERKRETKIYKADEDGRPEPGFALGVPRTKMVTRVELVGFEHSLGIEHPSPPAGTVTQMVDFGQTEKDILSDIRRIAKEALIARKAQIIGGRRGQTETGTASGKSGEESHAMHDQGH